MNEVLSQLHARKSVRAFLDRPISPEARRAILEAACAAPTAGNQQLRSEEHTSELQSPAMISYAVFCLKKPESKKKKFRISFYIRRTEGLLRDRKSVV